MANVYIVAAKRTPFGAFMGKLSGLTASELGGLASVAAVKSLPKDTVIDSVIYGNVLQTSRDAAYLARHVGHRAGLDIKVPTITVNRLCGSGFTTVIQAAQEIMLGEASVVLAGGSENMSQAPFALRDSRKGSRYGVDVVLEDTLSHGLIDSFPEKTPMGITAENLAKKYKITRKDADEYASKSQKRWDSANKSGIFKNEIVNVALESKKGVEMFEVDEHPRPQTTAESLGKLKPVFIRDTGVVTAGNASGICDGAASIIVAGEAAVKLYGLKPLARIVSWNYVGVDPKIMGIGPVPAMKAALDRAKLTFADMDIIEINEAFSAQILSVAAELKLDTDAINVNGGAIALGHPLGASGARILGHMAHELNRKQAKYAIGAACIGGGQGIAVILERV